MGLSHTAHAIQSRKRTQEPCLDVLALKQAAHGLVQGFARALGVAPARRVPVRAQPHLCAAAKLPAHGLDHLLRQLILHIVLWEFTNVLSQINESAELRRTLRQEREDLRRFVDRVGALSVSLADAPITFSAHTDEQRPAPILTPVAIQPSQDGLRDDRLVFSGLLTKRELDVLRLLAEGGTNKTIADALVLSETTVKFHVNSILRKLHVANRAEAVARYLSLLGLPSPQ